jgi:hypothetical protein
MQRLFRAAFSFETSQHDGQNFGKKWVDMQVAPQGGLWWDPVSPEQPGSWVELGEALHDAIVASPVPVDLRALRALKKSPLALDLYTWTTYKTYAVNRSPKEGQPVPWRSMQKQLGCDYSNPRHFEAAAKLAVRKVQAVFPGFHVAEYVDEHGGGLIVKWGTTSVPRRKDVGAIQSDQ